MIKIESNEQKIASIVGGFVTAGLGVYQVVDSVLDVIYDITGGYTSLLTVHLGQTYFWLTVLALGLFLIRLGNGGTFSGVVANIHSLILIARQNHQSKVPKVRLASDEKQCPSCGGVIKARARKCKHCHADVK